MLRRALAERLESGAFRSLLARSLASVWQGVSAPNRPLRLPDGATVIGVGGATLGGSGKTPLCLELVRILATQGVRVAVVASGYRAKARAARRVAATDDVDVVGDEALWFARELGSEVPVVVARSRRDAVELACKLADVVIVDSLLQTRPKRLALSLLVVDGRAPFGAGHCPPCGDMRASKAALLAACDAVVSIDVPCVELGRPSFVVPARLCGAREPDGTLRMPRELARLRLGLAVAVARPERVLTTLAEHGIVPRAVHCAPDHGVPRPPRVAVDAWLTTPKCATKLGQRLNGAPLWSLEQRLALPDSLVALAGASSPQKPGSAVLESAPCLARIPS
jgi:tetraacyldisaccharide 4'-kinase